MIPSDTHVRLGTSTRPSGRLGTRARARAEERGGRGGETRARARGSSRGEGQRAVARRERAGRGRETAAGERSRRRGAGTDVDARACVGGITGAASGGRPVRGGPAERGVFEGEHQTARAHPPGGRPGRTARGATDAPPSPSRADGATARVRPRSRAGRRPRLRRRGRARVARPSRASAPSRGGDARTGEALCGDGARGGRGGNPSAADVKRRMRAHVVRGYRGVRDPADTHAL